MKIKEEVKLIEIDSICGPVESISQKEMKRLLNGVGLEQKEISHEETGENEVHVLLGQDVFWMVVTGQYRRINESAVIMESLFGWSIEGKIQPGNRDASKNTVLHCIVEENKPEDWAEKLWSLEAIGIEDPKGERRKKEENAEVLKKFQDTIQFKEGRYSVKLPWKDDCANLGSNWTIAKERLLGLLKRFSKNPDLFARYKEAIESYMQQGHAEEVHEGLGPRIYYIPHHAVVREDRVTTKVRIVFDASAHKRGKDSLNMCLGSGPNLNPEIVHLLLAFRMNKIALTADIEKAFLQVSLAPEDRDATRFLWVDPKWKVGDKIQMKIFRMTRVLFGATCSPYLLAATLRHHAQREALEFPTESKMLDQDTYVDDLISGTQCIERADKIKSNIQQMIEKASMKMKKWLTNDTLLFERWKMEEIKNGTYEELNIQLNQEPTKVLGLRWDPQLDEIALPTTALKALKSCNRITKRIVLKGAAQVYDPLGYITPAVIMAKCLFQDLWKRKFSWDEELPEEFSCRWKSWCEDLQALEGIKWPRYINFLGEQRSEKQLHLFCDASQRAYGAAIYLRVEKDNKVETTLLVSKGRVAPVKEISLPRLELVGATIGARPMTYVKKREEFAEIPATFWCDSQVTLKWIQGTNKKWQTFVQNRVNEIRTLTKDKSWRYCSSQENPADLVSRGQTLGKLKHNRHWWEGPNWLHEKEENWPPMMEEHREDSSEEEVVKHEVVTGITTVLKTFIDLRRFGQLEKVIRVASWVLRAAAAFQKKVSTINSGLTVVELENAMKVLIRIIQAEQFPTEIQCLMKGKVINLKQSKIGSLNPYLDEMGIMRMGGRLQEASLTENVKHPILLQNEGRFVELLILQSHEEVFHAGVVRTLVKLRESYCIIKGRQLVKKVLNRCCTCRRFKTKPMKCVEANIPKERVTPTHAFHTTGVDFAGPVFVKMGKNRKKTYITLFTCAVTRAIHLELVTELTVDAFLQALRRFFARRGVSSVIYSDNAKTFKRANLELDWIWEIVENPKIEEYTLKHRIQWKFIAAKAAWWGGFWERMVQIVKRCLRKVLGKACITEGELSTILTEIEAVVNKRPISYVSDNPQAEEALTPAHFLNDNPNAIISVGKVKKSDECQVDKQFTRRWRHRQRLLDHFWHRWRNDYLLQLRSFQQKRCVGEKAKIKEDDVVLVHEHRRPRQMWSLARVKEVQVGRDSQVRSCLLKLGNGQVIRRPVQLIYPLEEQATAVKDDDEGAP